jgi:hypothetical protein
MKDKQITAPGTEPRIPVVSATVHCIAMTVLVFLRSSFGFAYLSPKSVFFAFSWAFILFTIFAWNEPAVWRQYRSVCLFGMAAAALYWMQLLGAFLRELYRKGEHDHYSGRSHALRIISGAGTQGALAEMNLHLWAEPAAVLLTGLVLRFAFAERHLWIWLCFAAICLWFKEAFNYWHRLRQQKRQGDIFDDAGDTVEPPSSAGTQTQEPPKATRKARVKRERSAPDPVEIERESRAAELLRLLPPYTLEKAEENYHALIKMSHPDRNEGATESVERSVALNEAIEFFRERLRG